MTHAAKASCALFNRPLKVRSKKFAERGASAGKPVRKYRGKQTSNSKQKQRRHFPFTPFVSNCEWKRQENEWSADKKIREIRQQVLQPHWMTGSFLPH
jgi:hypothetical protein